MLVAEVSGLHKQFGAFEALQDVSFQIEAGEVVGLLGPNGAGKSTTMKVLTGFLVPSSGSVRVAGHDVIADPIEARRNIGYLPENAPLYDEMTIGNYLDFVGRMRGLGPAERERAVERVTRETGTAERLGQTIGTLSKGFRQRVGLAQALIHQPALLILDEPTNGLDPSQIVEMRALIREVGRKRTVILSTHILSEAQSTCDRLLILNHGRLIADRRAKSGPEGHTITVGVAYGKIEVPDSRILQELAQLEGVTGVRSIAGEGGQYFAVSAATDVRETIFQWAVSSGFALIELSSARTDLEAMFLELTTRK